MVNSNRAPLKRDPEKTKNAILNSAVTCFSNQGYNGTSLNDILLKAGVNKRMVYHYFGSKKGLYREVHVAQWKLLYEWFARLPNPLSFSAEAPQSSQELLLRALEIFHDFTATHQEFLRLLMWDGLEGGQVSRSIWEEIRGPLYHRMEALAKLAQQQGYLAADLKIDHLIVTFMGGIFFYFSYANSLEDVFGKNLLDESAIQERRQQILKLFEKTFNGNLSHS